MTGKKDSLLHLLENREEARKTGFKGKNFSGMDLSGRDLTSIDFTGAVFKKGKLKKADFSRSVLQKGRFQRADLEEAVLAETNCRAADFSRASLRGADFSGADLRELIVYKTDGENIRIDRAVLKGANLTYMNLARCSGNKADLEGARLEGAVLTGADFSKAKLTSAGFSDAEAENTRFAESDLRGADLKGAYLNGADFSGADLRGADLSLTSLEEAEFEGAAVEGADFRFALGLSKDRKTRFKKEGARISRGGERTKNFFRFVFSRPWALAVFVLFWAALVFLGIRYFSDIRHRSINTLLDHLSEAREAKDWERVLELDLILLNKFKRREDEMGVFNRSLDAGRMYRRVGEPQKSMDILQGLLDKFPDDAEKEARVKLEMAYTLMETGDHAGAVPLLEDIKNIPMDKPFVFLSRTALADCYRDLGVYISSVTEYGELLQKFSGDPDRFSRILQRLHGIYGRLEGDAENRRKFLESVAMPGIKNIYRKLLKEAPEFETEIERHLEALETLSRTGR